MPSATNPDDDDPVVASYDVYMTVAQPSSPESSSKLFVLQYPAHRRWNVPYNEACSQKPTVFRLKPQTGMLEVDVPIPTDQFYDEHVGSKLGHELADGRILGNHGLAGGFSTTSTAAAPININDIPAHGERNSQPLQVQTLGGKIAEAGERDPLYMVGSFHNNELHLTHLDAVVQMRPQLHHIDAEEESRRLMASNAASSRKTGLEELSAKLESKAIEVKMKDSKDDAKDRGLNKNARLLRNIQADRWATHDWIDEADEAARDRFHQTMVLDQAPVGNVDITKQLQSTISNDDWLDKMSAPRDDGKKGLRAKLKGRDRERARRKKAGSQRQQLRNASMNPADAVVAEISSDTESSSADEPSEVEVLGRRDEVAAPEIKQEPTELAAAPALPPGVSKPAPKPTPRRKGRPRKNPVATVDLGD